MEDKDILPYLPTNKLPPPVEHLSRRQKIHRWLNNRRAFRGLDWLSQPIQARVRSAWKLHPRLFTLLLLVLAISSISVAYAAVTFTTSNSANVATGATLVGVGPETAGTTCSASTGTYSGSVSLNWGTVTQGTTAKEYVCVQNTGTGTYTISFTTTLAASDGSITSPQSGTSLASGAFTLVEFDWAVAPTAPTGAASFAVDFQ